MLSHSLLLSWRHIVWPGCVCLHTGKVANIWLQKHILRFTFNFHMGTMSELSAQLNPPRWIFNRRFEHPLKSFLLELIFFHILCHLNTYRSTYLPLPNFLPHSLPVLHSSFFSQVLGSCWWGNSWMLWQLTPTALPDSSLCPKRDCHGLGREAGFNELSRRPLVCPFVDCVDPCAEVEIVQTPTRTQSTCHLLLIKYVQAPQEMCTCVREVFSAYVCFCLMSI